VSTLIAENVRNSVVVWVDGPNEVGLVVKQVVPEVVGNENVCQLQKFSNTHQVIQAFSQ
jgi:hypothetical protein